MKIMIVEDDESRIKHFHRNCIGHLTYTFRDAFRAIRHLEQNTPDVIFLDHDLGGAAFQESDRNDCGGAVARWIAANKPNIPVVVHSLNPSGADYMVRTIPRAIYEPCCWLFDADKFARLIEHVTNTEGPE